MKTNIVLTLTFYHYLDFVFRQKSYPHPDRPNWTQAQCN